MTSSGREHNAGTLTMRIWNRFNRRVFLIALIIIAGGCAVWYWAYPAKFKVQARLQLATLPPKVLFHSVETESVGDDYKRYQNTQKGLIKSHLVLNAAIKDKSVSNFQLIRGNIDPISWLAENLKVEFVGGSELMEISLSGDNPVELAAIVNAVKRAYMEEVVNFEAARKGQRHAKLKELKREYENLLNERRARLRQSIEIQRGADPATIIERIEESMEFRRTLRSQLLNLELELAEAEALMARRKESTGSASDAVRNEIAQIEDRVVGMKARQKVLEQRLKEVNTSTSINGAATVDLESLKDEIATLEGVYRRIADAVEVMNVETQGPPRVRTIEDAVPPTTPFRASWWGSLASNGS
jgi:uncharacterized protein involved in exopolysaccharide biosynthesis